MKKPARIIVIDDELINNMLCEHVIKRVAPELEVKTFSHPFVGFEYVADYINNASEVPTLILLDINMPEWTGWDFLDNYEKLDDKVKQQFNIYILSSSVDHMDMRRAKENRYVVEYIVKPLTVQIVSNILDNCD